MYLGERGREGVLGGVYLVGGREGGRTWLGGGGGGAAAEASIAPLQTALVYFLTTWVLKAVAENGEGDEDCCGWEGGATGTLWSPSSFVPATSGSVCVVKRIRCLRN